MSKRSRGKHLETSVEKTSHFDIVRPDETYKGMSYSDLIKYWWNWIFSANPDYRQDYGIVFLRGNIGASYKSTHETGKLAMMSDPAFVYNRTGLMGITISTDSSLFFPIYDSQFVVGDHFDGTQVGSTLECRSAAKMDFQLLTAAWANYHIIEPSAAKSSKTRIVNDLGKYYAESSPFGLVVSDRNKMKDLYDGDPLQPGQYEGVAVGIYLLVTNFKQEGTYRFDFGGISRISYTTRAVYDIKIVKSAGEFKIVDVSEAMFAVPFSPSENNKK